MFDLLKTVLKRPPKAGTGDDALVQWAHSRLLSHMAQADGAFAMGGRLLDRPFRAKCAVSARAYIQGMELLARAELGLSAAVTVILMNRSLKRWLEARAGVLNASHPAVAELLHVLAVLPEAGWNGPPAEFWARYAVLTNAPDVARHWVDADTVSALMEWPGEVTAETPVLFVLTRGKCTMRMQGGGPGAVTLHALALFEHLCGRALQILDR